MTEKAPDLGPDRETSRRDFVRRAAYVAPLMLTLPAAPALAQVGSGFANPCDPNGQEFPTFDEDGSFLGCDS